MVIVAAPKVIVEPSARPLNVPEIASAPSLSMIIKDVPTAGVAPNSSANVAPPRLTVPSTSVWSYSKPTVEPSISTEYVAPLVSSRLPVSRIPGELPGDNTPIPEIVTAGSTPVPPTTPSTNTRLANSNDPFTSSRPSPTFTFPVLTFVPFRISVPVPFLSKSREPLITPSTVSVVPLATVIPTLLPPVIPMSP